MSDTVVVLGSGYAGAGAIKQLESELSGEADLTWISDVDYHFVLHESHRIIRDPEIEEQITIPVDNIKSPSTRFIEGSVVDVDPDDQSIELADDSTVEYDYLLIAIGSQTAFFGIDGLREHALTLKSRSDALEVHDAVKAAATDATRDDPATVVIGGAGLSGIQSAGEIAKFRDEYSAPIDIHLVEGLDEIFPGNDPELQGALRKRLEELDVNIKTGEFIGEVDEDTVYIGEEDELDYDVLLWTGGITGRECLDDVEVEKDDRSNRINTDATFQTNDDNIFAIGDTALIEQPGENPAPPTAQAAWQAAEVAGQNLARQLRGQPLKSWTHKDKGTVVSVGDEAVAHGVDMVPVSTFGGPAARTLKKGIAARWIADVSSPVRAAKAWPSM
jgi:NADH dehydrogenase